MQWRGAAGKVVLDFGRDDEDRSHRDDVSAAATDGNWLWTVADEGHRVHCFRPSGADWVLHASVDLGEVRPDDHGEGEFDLEALHWDGANLWLCGSHALRRKKRKKAEAIRPEIESNTGRCVLAIQPWKDGVPGQARALPVVGPGSLRDHLAGLRHLAPFLSLPTKENGLDIEGMTIHRGRVLLGLRGPVIAGAAVVVDLGLDPTDLSIRESRLHFLDLRGQGIRDLARDGDDVLVVSGAMGDGEEPFRLHRWRPGADDPAEIGIWDGSAEKVEGVCRLDRDGVPGLLVVMDSPGDARKQGDRYLADWIPFP